MSFCYARDYGSKIETEVSRRDAVSDKVKVEERMKTFPLATNIYKHTQVSHVVLKGEVYYNVTPHQNPVGKRKSTVVGFWPRS